MIFLSVISGESACVTFITLKAQLTTEKWAQNVCSWQKSWPKKAPKPFQNSKIGVPEKYFFFLPCTIAYKINIMGRDFIRHTQKGILISNNSFTRYSLKCIFFPLRLHLYCAFYILFSMHYKVNFLHQVVPNDEWHPLVFMETN